LERTPPAQCVERTWRITTEAVLDLDVPVPGHGRVKALDADAPIERLDVLGGLIHEYRRAA